MKKILKIAFLVTSIQGFNLTFSANQKFAENWQRMQDQYKTLTTALNDQGLMKYEPEYCLTFWKQNIDTIKHLILGTADKNFISNEAINKTMVRRGWSTVQDYEVYFLENCLGTQTKELLSHVSDTPFTRLPYECTKFNCSTNTLVHLYYAARAFEALKSTPIHTIVEFGGGYGNLTRIFKLTQPDSTLVIVDLPELLAIQYLFLTSTLPDSTKIIMHSSAPETLEPQAIHLIPIYIVDKCTIKTDLFISTFALSEATSAAQKLIISKNFFDARLSYIVGQLEGWEDLKLAHHSLMHTAIRNCYNTAICEPSYLFFHKIPAYEILGLNI